MSELIFEIHEAEEGGYWARALGESIFTEGDSWLELKNNILEAVRCHYFDRQKPPMVRMHLVRDELIAVGVA